MYAVHSTNGIAPKGVDGLQAVESYLEVIIQYSWNRKYHKMWLYTNTGSYLIADFFYEVLIYANYARCADFHSTALVFCY